MKNKIKQFSKGNFIAKRPDIQFSETQIYMPVGEGEVYEGSFLIQNQKDGNIRGLVYPSSFRVHCKEEGFDGNPVRISYTYDGTGLEPGYTEHGKFTVVCDGGEYELSFTAIVEKPYIMTAYGKVQTLSDFKKLAIQDYGEAKRMFRSRQFLDLLKYEDERIRNLYINMRTWSLDDRALEEFLVGIKQKEKIFLSLSETKQEFVNVLEPQMGLVEIVKNTWGYTDISITTEGEFIGVKRRELNTEDFVGNSYQLEYLIQQNKLHAGYNWGTINIATPYETLTVDVTVHQKGNRDEMRGMKGMVAGRGLKEYLALLSGKISRDAWVEKAIKRVDQLLELEPGSEYYTLLKAHIYLRGGREEEARWVLENHNFPKFMIGRKPEISAYHLFLTALLKQDTLYTNRALEDLNRAFMKHLYSWPILCMLVNLDPRYRDYEDRIRVLERQFFNGANHILVYAEAYMCYSEEVSLLRKLDSFEVQIMNFAAKYKMLSRELALRFADLVCQQKKYDVKLLRILKRAYEIYEEPRILQAICMQLIKGNKTGNEYYIWYEKAALQEMKIAQLYEYYMMSVNPKRIKGAFPRIVYLYFLHGINLDYKRIALLYANILTYENEKSDIYKQYYDQMKAFATEQLLKRNIDDSLSVIYNRFLHPDTITMGEMDALYDICHAYQITTDVKNIKYVVVIEKDGSIRQRVAYKPGVGAKIYLFHKNARIVWEGDDGLYYTDTIPYESLRLFHEIRYMELCQNRKIAQEEYLEDTKKVILSFETLRQYGLNHFDKQEIFLLCSKCIREEKEVADDFLLYLTFELAKEGFYDKATLTYLSTYYCGATSDMKMVWTKAREYGVLTKALAERIITQMIFSETMFGEEDIFEDYYTGKPYFRLKQAYLAYTAKQYVVHNRILSDRMIHIMLQELGQKEYLADICKVAILKYYVGRDVEVALLTILKETFAEMCKQHLIFPFYLQYPQEWLKEAQLYDKVMPEYHSNAGGKVKIIYRIQKDGEVADEYYAETLLPIYDAVYAKEFVLYEDESLSYYFEESGPAGTIQTEKRVCRKANVVYEDGKYGRLNMLARLSQAKQYEAMLHYKKEDVVAETMFRTY